MKPRVLIVDDSITVRMDLKEALEDAGFETALCATAAAARDLLRRQPQDLLILDVLLPDEDGLEFLRELKSSEATRATPVMLLSSEDEVRDRILGLKTGAEEYLGKPYQHAQVVSRARRLLGRGAGGRERRLALTIDDSATFRAELAAGLEEAGYEVAAAPGGEDGLRLAADLRPDVVLLDEQMPGLGGLEVLRRLRADAALRRLPCLLLTASQDRGSELRALEAGADAFVLKGASMQVVLAKMAALLRPGRPPRELEAASSLLGPKRVLAVDDSPTYLAELAGELRQEGYDVACAASGQEALDLLEAQSVDAILMDLVMPGLSGREACQRIKARQEWRDIPLVILTARSESEGMLEGINAGADDYITKGPDFDVLKARLKAQLRRRQFEDENRLFREQLLRSEMEALELRAVKELSESRAAHIAELEGKNAELRRAEAEARALAGELESFSYSVSHDLRAPLRSIDGFSRALQEDCAPLLDEQGRRHLDRVCAAVGRMERLIDDMLGLAQVSRRELALGPVDLSALAAEVAAELNGRDGGKARFDIKPGIQVTGDRGLLRILLENLMGNAAKFSAKREEPRIELFSERRPDFGGTAAVAVRDNGVGFDMAYVNKLFGAFQRLHGAGEFPGTGIGLATALRVVHRHGGRIWAEGRPEHGATFHFSW
jgi:DNA-binding response OmpR family regulator